MDDARTPAPESPGSGSENAQIENVSDTALMVAACRALETERPDGLVRDPFARRLAGERGMAIARASPIPEWMCFGVGTRARFMDELLTESLANGQIRTVANLGAGLDTRPWRLALDPGLDWIEADFPHMLEYKAARLGDVPPGCRLEQVATDLDDKDAQVRLFQHVGPRPALMITEGLLMYLLFSPDMLRLAAGEWKSPVEKFRPEDHLFGQALLGAVEEAGWKVSAKRTYAREGAAAAGARAASLLEASKKLGAIPEAGRDDISGIYLFKHA
ncbi:MAG: hypothetical protein DMG21_13125 [Acidobacteria bacterium]|nr:MAG: hypothetical protein DMG21_13125 [Acidobacteriota bacterium]